jgi:hypothetical protein
LALVRGAKVGEAGPLPFSADDPACAGASPDYLGGSKYWQKQGHNEAMLLGEVGASAAYVTIVLLAIFLAISPTLWIGVRYPTDRKASKPLIAATTFSVLASLGLLWVFVGVELLYDITGDCLFPKRLIDGDCETGINPLEGVLD